MDYVTHSYSHGTCLDGYPGLSAMGPGKPQAQQQQVRIKRIIFLLVEQTSSAN